MASSMSVQSACQLCVMLSTIIISSFSSWFFMKNALYILFWVPQKPSNPGVWEIIWTYKVITQVLLKIYFQAWWNLLSFRIWANGVQTQDSCHFLMFHMYSNGYSAHKHEDININYLSLQQDWIWIFRIFSVQFFQPLTYTSQERY